MRAALILLFAFAMPYAHVQADITFGAAPPGSHRVSVKVHLHDTGGLASSCIVTVGGQKKVTGVSANGDATVWFESLPSYKGYAVSCQVN